MCVTSSSKKKTKHNLYFSTNIIGHGEKTNERTKSLVLCKLNWIHAEIEMANAARNV